MARGRVAVVEELDGDDERREDDELRVHRVDVQLRGVRVAAAGERVALVRRRGGRTGEAPRERKLAVEGIKDADGEREGLEGEIGAREDGLDERDGRRREGGGRRDEVDEVGCGACCEVCRLAGLSGGSSGTSHMHPLRRGSGMGGCHEGNWARRNPEPKTDRK